MADLINAIQVGLTVTLLFFCRTLIATWWTAFLDALVSRQKWQSEQWLVVGIVIGFTGAALDNFYWGLHWLADFYKSAWEPVLFQGGPISNVLTRQIPGIAAAYFHLRAAYMMTHGDTSLNSQSMRYLLVGSMVTMAMLFGPRI